MDSLEERLRVLFLEDLQDGLRALREGTSRLERGDAGDAAEVHRELFRVAHSLKGAGHSASVPAAVTICHGLEEVFAELQSGQRELDPTLAEQVSEAVEALAGVERELRGGTSAPEAVAPVEAPAATGSPAPAQPRGPGAAGAGGPGPGMAEARLRVSVQTAEELVNQVTDLMDELGRAGVTDRAVQQAATRLVTTSHALRLQPFADVCIGLDRAVAEAAALTGKRVSLTVEGGDTSIERSVASALREPLVHLVRNATDHGIEKPEGRRQASKPADGTVRVRASVVDGTVQVTVTDDGAGVDLPALRAAARARGLPADETDDGQLAFAPGLSTASEVTVVSGRGVGLDAVRDRVERLGGAVRLSSVPGRGTEVVLSVPASLATVHVLLVRAGGTQVALPVTSLDRVEAVDRAQLSDLGGREVLLGAGAPVPVASLAESLGMAPARAADGRAVLVRVAAAAGGGALEVDAVDDEVEGVLRALPARVAGLPGVLGVLGMPGGGLAPVLHPGACLRRAVGRRRAPVVVPVEPRARTVLLAEDTLTTRVLQQSILEGAGYRVLTAADGAEAWRLLQTQEVDLVVTDIEMPNMTGIELCRRIRGSDRVAGLPVVLVTSLGADDDRRRGAEAGADAYLVKSAFDRDLLLQTLGRLL